MIIHYFLCFLNSDENVKTFSKIEMLFVLIDKMLFYDGDESQEKSQKMKNIKRVLKRFSHICSLMASKNAF